MSIDVALLRIIKYRDKYEKVAKFIPSAAMDKKTIAIAKDIGSYFRLSPEAEQLDFAEFRSLFFNDFHKALKDEDITFYNALLTRMETDASEGVTKRIINSLKELEFATNAANLIEQYRAGEDISIVDAIFKDVSDTKIQMERTINFEFATIDDSSIEEGLDDDTGYKWPLDCLNKTYRRQQPGDCTIIAARPGKGKTTFLCQNNWSMAQDMPKHKHIIWFNNESRRQKIMSRQIQAALFKTDAELHAMMKDGTLRPAYIEAMGTFDRVRVYDIHGKDHRFCEEILETIGIDNVGAIVFDMLDKVRMPLSSASTREDQRLEELYTWGRELGVLYNCPTFPTSQISADGAGLLFPDEHMLKDSKTGKQGACDAILMLGTSDDPMLAKVRGINMAKTKQKRAGQDDCRAEAYFDEDKGRYIG